MLKVLPIMLTRPASQKCNGYTCEKHHSFMSCLMFFKGSVAISQSLKSISTWPINTINSVPLPYGGAALRKNGPRGFRPGPAQTGLYSH